MHKVWVYFLISKFLRRESLATAAQAKRIMGSECFSVRLHKKSKTCSSWAGLPWKIKKGEVSWLEFPVQHLQALLDSNPTSVSNETTKWTQSTRSWKRLAANLQITLSQTHQNSTAVRSGRVVLSGAKEPSQGEHSQMFGRRLWLMLATRGCSPITSHRQPATASNKSCSAWWDLANNDFN